MTKESEVGVLLPCPFCGEAPAYKVWSIHNYHRAECKECSFEMDFHGSKESLLAAWNARARLPQSADDRGMAFVDGLGWVVQCSRAIEYVTALAAIAKGEKE